MFRGELAREVLAFRDEIKATTEHEDCDERIARLRAAATDVRLRDAQTIGDLLDDVREALKAAYTELERAEEHHRWHHKQDGYVRDLEEDDERLRVLMVIAEALDSLGDDVDA